MSDLNRIRILIVAQFPERPDQVTSALDAASDFIPVAYTTLERHALQLARVCDVVLVSPEVFQSDTERLIRKLRSSHPSLKILVTQMNENTPAGVETILAYCSAGASGYLTEYDSTETILNRIRAAFHGDKAMLPGCAALLKPAPIQHVSES